MCQRGGSCQPRETEGESPLAQSSFSLWSASNIGQILGTVDRLAASDFFTVEVATLHRLVTFYVLVVLELWSRRVRVAGITSAPDSAFMFQVGRNLSDPVDGSLLGKRFLILDRDT